MLHLFSMRIYTKTGDKGETGLFTGKRVPKDSPYVEAYGAIDELNSALGVAISFLQDTTLLPVFFKIQETLFQVGADLATPFDDKESKAQKLVERICEEQVKELENRIDEYDKQLPQMTAFIFPGGAPAGALLHLSRTICRRSERFITPLVRTGTANPSVLSYLNRLSDLLFVLARFVNHSEGRPEQMWHPAHKKRA